MKIWKRGAATVFSIFLFFSFITSASAEATEKLFLITAYYSPIPAQEKYVTGSYDGDIRLNGRGTNGADGTEVYPGMIAAPKTYSFGTKMKIPGVGTVAVHDRGGAILATGESGLPHDRLDIWMGYGDKGLRRALSWGLRMLPVLVYGVDPNIKEEVMLDGFDENERLLAEFARQNPSYAAVFSASRLFPKDIWYESTGNDVTKLQRALKELGYFESVISGTYDDTTKAAVFAFQKAMNIVQNENDLGAGHAGPQTRAKLEAMLDQKGREHLPKIFLGLGQDGSEVQKLQNALVRLGYHVSVTNLYDDQTVNAVLAMQKDLKVVQDDEEKGAGYFGPKTKTALTRELLAQSTRSIVVTSAELPKFLEQDLARGDSGPDVMVLQEVLRQLNFLRVEPTGYFGDVTAHAVEKLQSSLNVVTDASGTVDFSTREKINTLLASKRHIMAAIEERQKKILVAQTP